MKKKKGRRKLQAVFWLVFLAGCLWVVFAPHTRISSPPPSITVKVQHPSQPVEQASEKPPQAQAPEASLPSGKPASDEQPKEGSVTVPVIPEQPSEVPGRIAKIAIVIDDMGAEMKSSEKALRLPAPVTLSFLPYAVRTREQSKEARERGHEVLLHMPMEPLGHENPGKGALTVDLPMAELHARFETALASFTGFDGINNHMGSKFTAYSDGMAMVVDDLKERNLFFLDSRTSAQSIGTKIAREKGLPTIGRDIFLDDDPSPEAIRRQIALTERLARQKGHAVAIGHPHAATIDAIETWAAEAPHRGVELVPVNALVGF
ncbi:MAG: divergent polysaccharide deacetylase family protein [Alphaproteobacteria bacterium]|nr:divergent polysaccharide deacetylase family protein [Alphaproteobacteria bacterium]